MQSPCAHISQPLKNASLALCWLVCSNTRFGCAVTECLDGGPTLSDNVLCGLVCCQSTVHKAPPQWALMCLRAHNAGRLAKWSCFKMLKASCHTQMHAAEAYTMRETLSSIPCLLGLNCCQSFFLSCSPCWCGKPHVGQGLHSCNACRLLKHSSLMGVQCLQV